MSGLKKKYIQMSKDRNGQVNFKKAWALQRRAQGTRKKPVRVAGKKKTGKKRSYSKPKQKGRRMAKGKGAISFTKTLLALPGMIYVYQALGGQRSLNTAISPMLLTSF